MMSFHEKSAWASLLGVVIVHVPYFWIVVQHPMSSVGLLIVATIGLIILLTAFHIVNALMSRSIRKSGATPPFDEMDRTIELKAAKWAGFVLAFLVMSWILVAMAMLPAVAGDEERVPVERIMLAVQALYAGFVVANLAYYGILIGNYRVIAHG